MRFWYPAPKVLNLSLKFIELMNSHITWQLMPSRKFFVGKPQKWFKMEKVKKKLKCLLHAVF